MSGAPARIVRAGRADSRVTVAAPRAGFGPPRGRSRRSQENGGWRTDAGRGGCGRFRCPRDWGGPGGTGLRHRGHAGQRLTRRRDRQGRARQLDRRLSGADGVLLDAGAHRDRRLPVSRCSGYKPTREDALEYYRGVAAQERSTSGSTIACCDVGGALGTTSRSPPTAATHRARHVVVLDRLLRSAEPARRARRGPAQGHALLPRAVSVRPAEGRGHRRAELGRQGGARLLPPWRGGDADRSRRRCCRTRSSTGSSRISRTASRKAASRRYFNTTVESIDEDAHAAHAGRAGRRSRTTGSWR